MGDTIARNRRAHHDYSIEDTFEAGIVLRGTEIKSIRAHKVSLADAYARIERRRGLDHRPPHRPVGNDGRPLQPRAQARPEAAPPPPRDRRAPGQDQGQGPDDRAAVDLPLAGQGEDGAGPGARQADLGPAARDRGAGREAGHGAPGRGRATAVGFAYGGPTARRPSGSSDPAAPGRRDRCGSRGCSRRSMRTRRGSRAASSWAACWTSPAPRCSRRRGTWRSTATGSAG